jgi:hypothetical protein
MKPILCNTLVVQNILAGRQTQDRRPIKLPERWHFTGESGRITSKHKSKGRFGAFIRTKDDIGFIENDIIPAKYQVGDVLYVRETFGVTSRANPLIKQTLPMFEYTWYVMDGEDELDKNYELLYRATQEIDPDFPIRWRPNIHMPKWAARIFLKVTGVRVERIQDISWEDILAEGITLGTPRKNNFKYLWESIYPGSWDRNDWCFVYDFEMCEKP